MKTLSIRQPWAWLICSGAKDVENRSWRTGYRGPLLIHAGQTLDRKAVAALRDLVNLPAEYVTGALVGMAWLEDCTMRESSEWHQPGSWGWYLRNAVLFDRPVPMLGRLGLFETAEPAGWPPRAGGPV